MSYDAAFPPADFIPRLRENLCIIVVGVVVQNDSVLLIQEAKQSCYGKYFLPAGRLEVGETLVEGVKREVKEESGLCFEPSRVVLVETNGPFWLSITFVGDVVGGQLKTEPDVDSLQAGWFHLSQVHQAEQMWYQFRGKRSSDHPEFTLRAPVVHMIEAALLFRASSPLTGTLGCLDEEVGCMLYRLAVVWVGQESDKPSHVCVRLLKPDELPSFRLNGGRLGEAIDNFLQILFPQCDPDWDHSRL